VATPFGKPRLRYLDRSFGIGEVSEGPLLATSGQSLAWAGAAALPPKADVQARGRLVSPRRRVSRS